MKIGRTLSSCCLIVLVGLAHLLASCASKPAAPIQEPAVEENVFTLLNNGDSERAKEYFKGRADINGTDAQGRTALHIASLRKDSTLVGFLIEKGARIDARDGAGKSALEISAELSDEASVRLLAQAGASLFINDGTETGILRLLFKDKKLLSASLTKKNIDLKDSAGRTLLHRAVSSENLDVAKLLVENGAQVNEQDQNGKTPLDSAFEDAHSSASMYIAEVLIRAGGRSSLDQYAYCIPAIRSSNFDIRFDDGLAPLHFAAREGHIVILRYLLEKKANIEAKNASGAPPLHEAFRAGQIEAAKMLIQAGANVNARDAKGNTAMHLVMPLGARSEGLALLLSKGGDPNIKDDLGDSPLHVAVGTNMGLDIVQLLMANGADPNIRNADGKTPLHTAVERQRASYIRPLILKGADIFAADLRGKTPFDAALDAGSEILDAIVASKIVSATDKEGNTILHLAILRRAAASTIAKILDAKAAVNARNMNGDTPLHLAVGSNQRECGELLIARGADIFANNAEGKTPFQLAAYAPEGFRSWVLSSKTAETGDGLGNGVLHYAALWKYDELIPKLVQAGCDPNRRNATGETPLFAAIKSDSPSTIDTLIGQGAVATIRDLAGNTALHAAIRWNSKNALRALLRGGADIEAGNLHGKTALHESVRLGMNETEKILLSAGANLEARDLFGITPLIDAVQSGLAATVERLLDDGASIGVRDNEGLTPLHLAVGAGRKDIVRILLLKGASIHAGNAKGETPLTLALAGGLNIVELLLTKDRINAPNDIGEEPLHLAIKFGASEGIISRMVDLGADLSASDAQGNTPLHLALASKRYDIVMKLSASKANPFIATGADENAAQIALRLGSEAIKAIFSGDTAVQGKDAVGNSILHYAAAYSTPETIQLLLSLDAETSAKNAAGELPIDIARRWKRADVEKLLSK